MVSRPLLDVPQDEIGRDTTRLRFDLDSYRDKLYLTHNFHPYPAKFVPQIPRVVIEAFSRTGETILDPFCGSGTALVEANLAGRDAVGIDINPIAALAARVKTRVLSHSQIAAVRRLEARVQGWERELRAGMPMRRILAERRVRVPEFLNRDHWFQKNIQMELALIRSEAMGVKDLSAREFCLLALSAIIVKVSNQDSETRWAAVPKGLKDGAAFTAFLAKLGDMVARITEYARLTAGATRVIEQTVESRFPIRSEWVDLIVTSPPYMNSFDYYLYHKLRCYWLGFDHYKVQAAEIGSRNKHCDQSEGSDVYSKSMARFFEESFRALKRRGFATIVVGDAIFRGQVVDMLPVFQRLGKESGFQLAETWSYDQRKYTTSFTPKLKTAFKRTHIISFQKP